MPTTIATIATTERSVAITTSRLEKNLPAIFP